MIDPQEQIQIVDKNDNPTGGATKPEAWKKGLIHRIVRIIVENSKGEILLQKRSSNMQLFPDCWDQSASRHVDKGESYEDAAKRELSEEIGVTDRDLTEIGKYYSESAFEWRQLNRFTRVYKVVLDKKPQNLGAEEVVEVKWFTPNKAKMLVKNHPDRVTDGLRQVLERFY